MSARGFAAASTSASAASSPAASCSSRIHRAAVAPAPRFPSSSSSSSRAVAPACRSIANNRQHKAAVFVAAAAVASQKQQSFTTTEGPFAGVTNGEAFAAVLKAGASAGKIPPQLVDGFLDFYQNYRTAVVGSGVPGADEAEVARVMTAIADRVLDQFKNPYTFPSAHERILAPYDYYAFGQNYVRNLVDFNKSAIGNLDRFQQVEAQLARGDNVVLLANHQTEADPAVWALLLEGAGLDRLASDVAYVAGDRVVTDPLCKPFSMGRNLFCVHSKKHMDDDPSLKEEKQRTNRRTLGALGKALARGGQLLWIAPSGGRDRPDQQTGEWSPARFDPAAVELMRQLTAKASPQGHLWPLAMESGDMMPPPPSTEKAIGERRLTNYVGVGISLGEELDLEGIVKDIDEKDRDARAGAVSAAAYAAVCEQYDALKAAVRAGGATADGAFVQPWKQ